MRRADGVRKHRLTVFLIKSGYRNIEDFLTLNALHSVKIGNREEDGVLFYQSGFRSKPGWVEIFEGVPGFNSKSLYNQGTKALFVLQRDQRWFCFTFGFARHLIDDLAYERNFGLKVALNLGDPTAIRSIDKTNINYVSLHSREQSTKEVELASFEFNTDIDLLKSVTAKSDGDGDDQETFSGRDSVSINTRVTLEGLGEIADRLHKAFSSKKYKERYPWIDKIVEERDSAIIESLDAFLIDCLQSGDFSNIWLAIPEVINWEDVDGFSYKTVTVNTPKKAGPVLHQDLDIGEWIGSVAPPAEIQQLKNRKVFLYWKDGRPPTSWNLYRCLNAEIDQTGKKYILNDGDWYNIDTGYVSEITKFYNQVPDSQIVLPKYGFQTEPNYLQSVAATHSEFALMDRKEVMIGGGRSRIEFCDLYSKSKQIIHVKKYGGSGLLSHLFTQAQVSGDCFLHEPTFRSGVNSHLPPGFKLKNAELRPTPKEYEVCMGIMSKVPGPLELPFFSKVSFRYAVRNLTNLGYNVTKLKIER